MKSWYLGVKHRLVRVAVHIVRIYCAGKHSGIKYIQTPAVMNWVLDDGFDCHMSPERNESTKVQTLGTY